MAISEKSCLRQVSAERSGQFTGPACSRRRHQHLIDALSRRFRVSVWITVALVLVMLVTLIAGSRTHILSGA
jgi:hypothetical protein